MGLPPFVLFVGIHNVRHTCSLRHYIYFPVEPSACSFFTIFCHTLLMSCWSLWPAKVTSYKHGSLRTSSISCSILSVDRTTDLTLASLRLLGIWVRSLFRGWNNQHVGWWRRPGNPSKWRHMIIPIRQIGCPVWGKNQPSWIFYRTSVLPCGKPDAWKSSLDYLYLVDNVIRFSYIQMIYK